MSEQTQEPPTSDGQFPHRRRHPRARVDLVVSLKFASVQEFMNAKAEDLSVGGMFLREQQFGPDGELRQVGQLLALRFDAGNQRMIEGLARVVRVVTPEEPDMVPGVGVEFLDLDEKSERLIQAIVDIKLARPFGA